MPDTLYKRLGCKLATKWNPTRTLKQGFDLWALFAWSVGSQSAPIGTPP